jgi:hypothetical protein
VVISTQHAEPLKAKRTAEQPGTDFRGKYTGPEMLAPSMEEMNELIHDKVILATLEAIKLKNGKTALSIYDRKTCNLHINPSGKFYFEHHRAKGGAAEAPAEAEAEAEAMAGEEEVAEAAVAQLRGHSRQHAATILSSNPYFEQVGEDEGRPVQEDAHPDGKLERLYRSGRCEVLYATGTRKEVMPSGLHTVFFCNGDVKQTAPSRRVVYYHAEADTTHVSEPDGTQIYHFPNQQVERHFTDGLKEISFPDGMVKVILPNGDVQTIPTISKREPQQPTRQPVGAR